MREEWIDFNGGAWESEINVRDFIQKNYTPYNGDDSFLCGPTKDTLDLWQQVSDLKKQEIENGGVLDMDTRTVSTITSHGAAYINKDKEQIVGLQTDKPLKRALQPYGGIRVAMQACKKNGYEVDPEIVEFFTEHRKTHNAGVFDVYTPEMRKCRSSHIITGLPDGYGRGRIIGDYRRVALYGIDRLIEDREAKNRGFLVHTHHNRPERVEFLLVVPLLTDCIGDRSHVGQGDKQCIIIFAYDVDLHSGNKEIL